MPQAAIEDLRPSQNGDTRYISTFSITFKQINQVDTLTIYNASSPNPAGTGTQLGNNLANQVSQAVGQGLGGGQIGF